jgi:hypothetical protein
MEEALKAKLYKDELELIKNQFAIDLFSSFKVELRQRLHEWYKLEWMDFRKEILKTGEMLPYRKQHDLQEYFINQKKKVLSLSKELGSIK